MIESEDANLNPTGSGIGLTVSKKYIEYLGGNIDLQSDYNVGTTVSFDIPLTKGKPNFGIGNLMQRNESPPQNIFEGMESDLVVASEYLDGSLSNNNHYSGKTNIVVSFKSKFLTYKSQTN